MFISLDEVHTEALFPLLLALLIDLARNAISADKYVCSSIRPSLNKHSNKAEVGREYLSMLKLYLPI